jgi:hypothetical protein
MILPTLRMQSAVASDDPPNFRILMYDLTHSRELAGNFAGSAAINARSACCLQRSAQFFQQLLPPRPGFVARFFVAFAHGGIGWFSGAHETVAGAFVDDRFILFAGSFH